MILDGKALAATLRSETAQETAQFIQQTGVTPCLAAILVGDKAKSYGEALSLAAESIDSGRALAKLNAMLEAMR